MVTHVKGFRTFHADLRTENTRGSSVVGFERRACGRLWVAHLCEGSNDGDGLLSIEKETAGFGFRGRGSNTPKGFARNMDSTVGGGFGGIAGGSREVGEKKKTSGTTVGIGQDVARLRALGRTRYAASEQIARTMSLAW
jgi:hypothetical protein